VEPAERSPVVAARTIVQMRAFASADMRSIHSRSARR